MELQSTSLWAFIGGQFLHGALYSVNQWGLRSRDKRNVQQAAIVYLQEHDTFVGSGNFYFSFLLYFPWWLSSKPFRGRDSISGFCVHCVLRVKSDVGPEWREIVRTSLCARKNFAPPKKSNELFFSHHFATFVSFCLLFFSFHSHALFFSLNCYEPCFLFCPVHGPVVPSRHCATEGNTGVRFPSCLTWSQLFIISTRVLFLLLSVPNPFWSEADLIH